MLWVLCVYVEYFCLLPWFRSCVSGGHNIFIRVAVFTEKGNELMFKGQERQEQGRGAVN